MKSRRQGSRAGAAGGRRPAGDAAAARRLQRSISSSGPMPTQTMPAGALPLEAAARDEDRGAAARLVSAAAAVADDMCLRCQLGADSGLFCCPTKAQKLSVVLGPCNPPQTPTLTKSMLQPAVRPLLKRQLLTASPSAAPLTWIEALLVLFMTRYSIDLSNCRAGRQRRRRETGRRARRQCRSSSGRRQRGRAASRSSTLRPGTTCRRSRPRRRPCRRSLRRCMPQQPLRRRRCRPRSAQRTAVTRRPLRRRVACPTDQLKHR